MSASFLLAVAISGLCVAEAARAKITTWNLFFPLLITVTDPSLSTAERGGPQVHPAIQDG